MTIFPSDIQRLVVRFANNYVAYVNENSGTKLPEHIKRLNEALSITGKYIFNQLECNHNYYLSSLKGGKYDLLVYLREAKDTFLRLTNEAIQELSETIERLENGGIHRSVIQEEVYAILKNDKAKIFAEGDDIILEVKTDEITLEGNGDSVCLNEMLIQFSLEGKAIRVRAVEPVYVDGFFHPHVCQDGDVCEGDAEEAITSAINSGRLVDLFDIVSSLLHTYNPRSPYRELLAWTKDKMVCWECGYDDLDEDNSYCCEHINCEHILCEECRHYCDFCSCCYCSDHMSDINGLCLDCYNNTAICSSCNTRVEDFVSCDKCGEIICNNCSYVCADCDDTFCERCLDECPNCKDLVCEKCLSKDESEEILCLRCEKERKEIDEEEEE